MLALVAPVMGVEFYGGGVYHNASSSTPMNQAWGGEVQIRQELGDSGLLVGLGLGTSQWRMGDKNSSSRKWCMTKTEKVFGDIKDYPVELLAMYKAKLGDSKILAFGELGVAYHITDTDIQYTEGISVCGMGRERTTDAGFNLGNLWTGRAGGGVEIPMGNNVSLAGSCGYQWQLNQYSNGRILEGLYGRVGLVIKM